MNSKKEYIVNTITLLIGKFSTQFVSFLLIPLYTRFLIASDYGFIDLIQTYITLFVPIFTLKLDSATFRFLIDCRKDGKEKERNEIVTNVLAVIFFLTILVLFGMFLLRRIIKINYYGIVCCNIFVLMISNILLQFLRGLGKNKSYSISTILMSLATLISNFVLIIVFKFNASSILISSTIANVIGIIYISTVLRLHQFVDAKLINKKKIKDLLFYSLPMIPNQLSWWIVNISDRTIITHFINTAANAVYTVSCKFSNIVNTIFAIFSTSWQETASLHINDKNSEEFLSDMMNSIFILFASFSIIMMAMIPFVFEIMVGENYRSGFNYIPILLLGNIFNILVSLLGGVYIALKMVKQVANTTIISAILNILINLLLIKKFGLYAASASTLLAYLIMAIYRYIDIKKYLKIKLNFKKILAFFIAFFISSGLYFANNLYANILNLLFVTAFCIILNKSFLITAFYKIENKFLNRQKRKN